MSGCGFRGISEAENYTQMAKRPATHSTSGWMVALFQMQGRRLDTPRVAVPQDFG